MNYYQAYLSPDPKIIGVSNGIFQIEIDKTEIDKNIAFENFRFFFNYKNNLFWINQKQVFNLTIPKIKAKKLKKAKLTDIMGYKPNISFLYNVYSSKFIDILKQFNINNFKLFEVEIEDVNETYYLLYPLTLLLEDIIYEKSVIYTGYKILKNLKYYSINSYEEYKEFVISNPIHTFEKICISKKYQNLDFISIQAVTYNFYSERLIKDLLAHKITGLHISYNNSVQLEFL